MNSSVSSRWSASSLKVEWQESSTSTHQKLNGKACSYYSFFIGIIAARDLKTGQKLRVRTWLCGHWDRISYLSMFRYDIVTQCDPSRYINTLLYYSSELFIVHRLSFKRRWTSITAIKQMYPFEWVYLICCRETSQTEAILVEWSMPRRTLWAWRTSPMPSFCFNVE